MRKNKREKALHLRAGDLPVCNIGSGNSNLMGNPICGHTSRRSAERELARIRTHLKIGERNPEDWNLNIAEGNCPLSQSLARSPAPSLPARIPVSAEMAALETTKTWLCYFELHVDDRTFLVHVLVEAETETEAFKKMDTKVTNGPNHHLQAKGILGEMTNALAEEYLDLDGMLQDAATGKN